MATIRAQVSIDAAALINHRKIDRDPVALLYPERLEHVGEPADLVV
jgi:hypothetical protein